MHYRDLVKPSVLAQPVYEPGKPIEYVAREFGLDPAAIVKLASNENPLGPSPLAREAAVQALSEAQLYPDGGCCVLRDRLAEIFGLRPEQFILGNGSNEIIELLGHAFVGPGDEVVMGSQAFIVYKLITLLFGGTPVEVPMPAYRHDLDAMRKAITPKTRLVFVASPNNPTGCENTAAEIRDFVESLPDHVIFVLDEAYAEYMDAPADLRPLISAGRKVLCTRTFSKIYGLAGLRVGYGYGPAELVKLLHQVRQPFNVNSIAQAAALAALGDKAFVERSRAVNAAGLRQLNTGLRALGFSPIPSVANFVAVEIPNAKDVFVALQKRGLIVRPLAPYGMRDFLRITVGTEDQNARLLAALSEITGRVPR